MTRLLALTLCLIPALGTTAEIAGYMEFGASAADAEPALTDGGVSTAGRGDGLFAEARLSIEQRAFDERVLAFASMLARSDEGRHVGLIEAFVDVGRLSHEGYRVRLGQAFAGTSRENIEAFWQTPYTLSLSALNAWIGEEFRPIGAELTRRFQVGERKLDVGLTGYVGNDTGPAALAWRGFALHNRLSVYGEALPLLPLPSLSDRERFGAQRPAGTQPFGPDLDGRIGYALRGRFDTGQGLRLAAYYTDNRGDQGLHDGDEYAWYSQFAVLGFDWQLSERWTLLGELLHGDTLMGSPPGPNVDIDFDAAYLLLSYQDGPWTWSGRIEAFHIGEKDRSISELNTQDGSALTLAVLREWSEWRIGAELLVSDIARPGNAEFAGNTDQGGVQAMLLARRYF